MYVDETGSRPGRSTSYLHDAGKVLLPQLGTAGQLLLKSALDGLHALLLQEGGGRVKGRGEGRSGWAVLRSIISLNQIWAASGLTCIQRTIKVSIPQSSHSLSTLFPHLHVLDRLSLQLVASQAS